MSTAWSDLVERFDSGLGRRGYRFLSVDVDRERARLRAAGRPFAGGGAPPCPTRELDATAAWLLQLEVRRRGLGARLAGMAGAASVPGEVLGRSLVLLRLAQRLCIVYGFDPRADRGRTAFWRALGAALEADLPSHAPLDSRASSVLRADDPSLASHLSRALLLRSQSDTMARITRFVPVLGGLSRPAADPALQAAGERMIGVLSRLAVPCARPTVSVEETD